MTACLQNAYNTGFGEHHPWIVRKGASAAMYAAGNRDQFFQTAGVSSAADFNEASGNMEKVRATLTKFLTENKLTELPWKICVYQQFMHS